MNDLLLPLLVLAVLALSGALVYVLRRPVAPPESPDEGKGTLGAINQQLTDLGNAVRDLRSTTDSKTTQLETALKTDFSNLISKFADLERTGTELSNATQQISTALQGTGVSGDWGELQLRRTVELAGLTEHISFIEQTAEMTPDGKKIPDMKVLLPTGRTIIVDAKAPKIDFTNGGDAARRQAVALKGHIDDLEKRDYSRYIDGALDFVVIFLPTEGMLAAALTGDSALAEYAIQKRILLATPMTLLALLRAVEYGWKQVAQMDNARDIATAAAELHDRLATFVEHFNKVGSGLESAIRNFNAATGSLERSVKPQARRMRELGVTASKQLTETEEIAETARSTAWELPTREGD